MSIFETESRTAHTNTNTEFRSVLYRFVHRNVLYKFCAQKCAVQDYAQKSDFSLVISFAGPKEFFYRGHNYFFSGNHPQYRDTRVDWLDARNICREYCMDLVSMEGQEENNIVFRIIQQSELHSTLFVVRLFGIAVIILYYGMVGW